MEKYVVLGSRFKVTSAKSVSGIYSSTGTKEVQKRVRRENIFAECKGISVRKRVRNSFSSEQAGRVGMVTHEVRTPNTYGHVVCKSRAWF